MTSPLPLAFTFSHCIPYPGPGEGMQDIQATSDPVGEAVQTDDVGEAAPVMCTTGTRTSGQTAVSLQGDNFSGENWLPLCHLSAY